MVQTDILIIGQGLAGTALAVTMLQQNQKVIIIDDGNPNGSSRVSAGLVNPVVFKRYLKSWMADDTLHTATEFYKREEEILGTKFFYDKPVNKILSNEKERSESQVKYQQNELQDFADDEIRLDFEPAILAPLGAFRIRKAGYLEPRIYLDLRRAWFLEKEILIQESVDYSRIKKINGGIQYGNIQCCYLVFCEGVQALNNPWLKQLPFKNTKGEIITIETNLNEKEILTKQVFVLPLGDNKFRVGSTYVWDPQDELPTDAGKKELVTKYLEIVPEQSMIVTDHVAGTRPTMVDRRPVIGIIPGTEYLAVFNGLGSRGVMLAPLMASCLTDMLVHGKAEIPAEADSERFAGLY